MGQISEVFAGRMFDRRVEKCRERLFRMAYSWCHDRFLAEDMTQQALLKALEKRAQLRDADRLESWLMRILANTMRDWFRRERPSEEIDDHHSVQHYGPEQVVADDEIVERVRRAVAKLPLSQCQTLTLVDLEGYTYAEVAMVLDVPIGTVMSRLSRARQSLKGHLEQLSVDVGQEPSSDERTRLRVVR